MRDDGSQQSGRVDPALFSWTALKNFKPDTEQFEEVPLGPGQAMGTEERWGRLIQVVVFGLILSSGVFFWYRRLSGALYWVMLPYGCIFLYALYRLGVRPVQFGAASVAPGLVRMTRGMKTAEFSRENLVLIVRPAGSTWSVCIASSGGATRQFRFSGGADDPALHQLIARWSWRNGSGARWQGSESREDDLLPAGGS